MAFDVEGAKKAGYSNKEIMEFLAKEQGFDLGQALKAGYGQDEILSYLIEENDPVGDPGGTPTLTPSSGEVSAEANLGEITPGFVEGPPPRGLLPTAGTMLGTGLGALTPVGPYYGGIAGGGLGSLGEDYLYDEQSKEQMAKNALGSMIAAGVAGPTGQAVEAVTAPGARAITPEARSALQFAERNAVPISLAEISPHWINQLFSQDVFAAGRLATTRYARQSEEFLVGFRSKMLEDILGIPATKDLPIKMVPSRIRPAMQAAEQEAYEAPLQIVKDYKGDADALVRLENMRKTAGRLLQDVRVQNAPAPKGMKVTPKEWLETFLSASEKQGGSLPFTRIHRMQSEVNRVFRRVGDEGGAPLLRALSDDLGAWDDALGKLLNNAYTAARAKTKDKYLFDTIYNLMASSTNVDKKTGAEVLDGLRLATRLTQRIKVNNQWVTPEAEILEKLGKERGTQVIEDLKALANYAMHTQGLRSKSTMKIIDTSSLLSGGIGGAASGVAGGGLVGAALPQGTSLALAVFLTGPGKKGFLRAFLSPAGGRPLLQVGTKATVQYGLEQGKQIGTTLFDELLGIGGPPPKAGK